MGNIGYSQQQKLSADTTFCFDENTTHDSFFFKRHLPFMMCLENFF